MAGILVAMSSWFVCECGNRIGKNLFAGNGLHLAIAEEALDHDFSDRSAEELVDQLMFQARLILTCTSCRRLYILDEWGRTELQVYVPEAPGPST